MTKESDEAKALVAAAREWANSRSGWDAFEFELGHRLADALESAQPRRAISHEDKQDLRDLLVNHYISREAGLCHCGHGFSPGDSFVAHHVDLILAAGFHRTSERSEE